MIYRFYIIFSLITYAIFLSACSTLYQPISQIEADAFARVRHDIFPYDLIQHKVPFNKTEVAWAGVITESNIDSSGNSYKINFTIQHHYFDWVEDRRRIQTRYLLSPRGEGTIKTRWELVKSLKEDTVLNEIKVGRMIVIYGLPVSASNNSVTVQATYLRTFEPSLFRTDIMDYGRPGEPVKLLKTVDFL